MLYNLNRCNIFQYRIQRSERGGNQMPKKSLYPQYSIDEALILANNCKIQFRQADEAFNTIFNY